MDDKKRIVTAIRDYLARERMSREQFAFKTKLGKSTVDKLLTGLFSERTLVIVETHTQLSLRSMLADSQNERVENGPRPAAPTPPDKPSIAVLPFTSFGANPDQDFLADGIAEDIITALTRLRWLLVIARNSSFVYKGKAVDVRQVAQDLGVRYLLEGSVRTAGERIRITGQLIDAETGKHIWAEKYDGELKDVFAVKDDIAEQVVAAVEPHLYVEEGFRAASKQPDSVDAWGLVVRALNLTSKLDRAAERGSADAAAPRDRDGAWVCARPRAPRLDRVVGRMVLLESGQAHDLPPDIGARRSGAVARLRGPVGTDDRRSGIEPIDAIRSCAFRAAHRAASQPELCARPHGVRLGAHARRPLR